jgi:acetate CoA/acetoacetate CoA-transferase alpha subunit
MKKALPVEVVVEMIEPGSILMIGGFMGIGSPHRMIDALVEAGTKDLTVIANDTGKTNYGIGRLITSGQIKHVIASHIGLNPETQAKMFSGEITVDLVPQGNLAERIRAAGFGLGGILVKTGIGTLVEEEKQRVHVNGEDWLLETPLFADYALIHAHQADYLGNLAYQLTATNFNPVMAMAARKVFCETNEIVPVGMITPNEVITPGAIVTEIVAMPHRHH